MEDQSTESLLPKELVQETRLYKLALNMFFMSIPTMVSNLVWPLHDSIAFSFIGRSNDPLQISAFGFGLTWASTFCNSILIGIGLGYTILSSQAFGAKNYKRVGLFFQAHSVVLLFTMLFAILMMWYSEALMKIFGFDHDLARECGKLLIYWIPSLIGLCIYSFINYYLISQKLFHIGGWVVVITTILHPIYCYIFYDLFWTSLEGIAIAKGFTNMTMAALIYFYVRIYQPSPESWFPWTKECLENIWKYTIDVYSIGANVYVEIVTFEVTTVIIAYLDDLNILSAHAAALNFVYLSFTPIFSCALTASTFAATAAGAGLHESARKDTMAGFVMTQIYALVLCIFLLIGHDWITGFYTTDDDIRDILARILIIYALGLNADAAGNALGACLRSVNQQNFVFKATLFTHCFLTIFFSVVFGYILKYSYYGVWGGFLAGFYGMGILTLWKLYNIEWRKEVKAISKEMKRDNGVEMNGIETGDSLA